jgi:hypothetical protein
MAPVYVNHAVYEMLAERYLRHLGLPLTHVDYDSKHHLKPKPSRKAYPRNGRRGRRSSKPRHGGSAKRTGN